MAKEAKKEGKGVPALLLIGGAAVGAAVALFFATRAKAATEIPLTAGWNDVVYTGKKQKAEKAFLVIWDYIVAAFYWTGIAYSQILPDTILEPGMELHIQVRQDCTWTL